MKNIFFKKIKLHNSKIVLLIFFLIVCGFFISCQKYLDIKPNSAQRLIETANDCQLLLDSYSVMNINYPSDGEVSSDDYFLTNSGYLDKSLTDEDRQLYIWSGSVLRDLATSAQWNQCYQVVYQANLVLETLTKLTGSNTDQTTLNNLKGSALFFRSFAFWQIAQLYAKPYVATTAAQDPGIPIRLSSDFNDISSRGTVEQTYRQIVEDLQTSAEMISANTPIVSSRPSKTAAYAMLARVYLSMENYASALANATLALQLHNQLIDFNTLDQTSDTPFGPIFGNAEEIFHSVTVGGRALSADPQSYNLAKIDSSLVASYKINDLRKQIFFKKNIGQDSLTYRFTGNFEPTTQATFFNGLATDELYLTRAECYARAGNINLAMADLNILLKSRWVTGTYIDQNATTADDALSIILIERRKELLMRSLRWTDLRRLNHDSRFAITLKRINNGTNYNLAPNDLRYVLLIPSQVINNSNLAQNPR